MTLPTIFPPSSLPKFLAAGHGIELGNDYAPVPRGRGHSRLRPKSSGAPRIVSVAWKLTEAQAADFDFWIETSLDRGTRHFAAEVANQGPGQLFWDAVWVSPPRCEPQAATGGLLWTVTGRILLTGEGSSVLPVTGDLSAEIEVPLLGSASLVLPDTPLAAEIVVALLPITAFRAEITVPLLPLLIPLAAEILVPLDGSAALSGSSSSGTSYSLTVEELDGSPSQVDPPKLIFPNGSLTLDTDGNATVTFSATPGGSDTHVQYNDGGVFGGEAGFTYDKTANLLTVPALTSTGLVTTPASATGSAGLTLPHGTAPTSPVNGNLWSTTAGFYGRVNGVTVGPFAAAGGALLYWTESQSTAAPNATINAAIFTPISSGASGSAIISWKGTSGFLAVQVPDNTSTGGNLRGVGAVDFQSSRGSASQVASGPRTGLLATQNCTNTGTNSLVAGALTATVSGNQVLASGNQITSTGDAVLIFGQYASDRGVQSLTQGSGASVIGKRQRQAFVLWTESAFSSTLRTLTTDGGAASTANMACLPNNSVYGFTVRLLMLAGSDYWDVEIKGTCYRGANAAATVINGVTTAITGTTIYQTAAVPGFAWAANAIADTTNGGIAVRTSGDGSQIVTSDCTLETIQLAP